ncbi:hypothetical protein [Dyella sp. EPa41]|uniref:hypothetical protein n=1 Tax=Dyella sp. EPa41 TaxID=1561194 RepID=UPI0019166728|nr:hypothetical protein [Dyella sp. EPa41]
MTPPTKPISLSDIHDVYRGSEKKRDTAKAEHSYRKTNRFSRDEGHSGAAPNRPPSPSGRKVR